MPMAAENEWGNEWYNNESLGTATMSPKTKLLTSDYNKKLLHNNLVVYLNAIEELASISYVYSAVQGSKRHKKSNSLDILDKNGSFDSQ